MDYLGLLLNLASDRWKVTGSDSVKLFFTCLETNSTTESAVWLRKMKAKMIRICFASAKESGEEMDKSVEPVYREHLRAISKAYGYALDGSPEVRTIALPERAAADPPALSCCCMHTRHRWHVFCARPHAKRSPPPSPF
eukprot:7389315-Prymnesium_polylepis.1